LLLGYSGGQDSKALLYALLECGVKPHLAHVDHGWREESAREAQYLKKEADSLGCPFYTVRLRVAKKEDEARRGRFSFFQSLMEGYSALLLAHQAEDLAETALKRVLEGAHLCHLSGMQPISQQYGMNIWRPFLSVRRSEIIEFLEERELRALVDASNFDPAYLRARMRRDIFPFLNEVFGKETSGNLLLLSQRASELKDYLDEKVKGVEIQEGPWGSFADVSKLAKLEQRHLIQKIARLKSVNLSRDVLETLLSWLESGVESKHLQVRSHKIWVGKGRICFFSSDSTNSQ